MAGELKEKNIKLPTKIKKTVLTMRAILLTIAPLSAIGEDTLGNMYRFGQGVTQDYKEAVCWYRLEKAKQIASAWMILPGKGGL